MSTRSLEMRWRTLRILWGALLAGQLVFPVVLWMLRYGPDAQPVPSAPPAMLAPVVGIVGISFAALSFVVPPAQFRKATGGVTRPRPGESLADAVLERLLGPATVALILSVAMSEAVTLLGFALGMLGFGVKMYAPFFATGIALTLMRMPTTNWLVSLLPEG
jgi:hypothetical protein